MPAAIGDIVTIPWHTDGRKWVVTEYLGSPSGDPLARLQRPRGDGSVLAFVCSPSSLPVVETPEFALGERVRLGFRAGEIIALNADTARVAYDPFPHQLSEGHAILMGGEGVVPYWHLTLENRMK